MRRGERLSFRERAPSSSCPKVSRKVHWSIVRSSPRLDSLRRGEMHTHEEGHDELTARLPPVPDEAHRLETFALRRVRAVYEDVPCGSPVERLLGKPMR